MKDLFRILSVYFPLGIGIVVGFVNQKLYALYAGPEHFPEIGDFLNYFQLFTLISSAGIGVGVVKMVAQYHHDPEQQRKVTANALLLVCACTVIVLAVLPVAYCTGSLKNINFTAMAFLLACIVPISISQLGFSLLNGHNQLATYNYFQTALHLVNLVVTYFLVINMGVTGIMISICLPMGLIGLVLVPYLIAKKEIVFHVRLLDRKIQKRLLQFSAISAVIVFLLPFSSLVIRNAMENTFSATETGYWQSCMNLSRFLISFITAVMPVYFIPRISRNPHPENVKKELRTVLLLFAFFLGIYLFAVVVFGQFIISLLFTGQFRDAQPYLVYTTIGDVCRIMAIPFSFILLSSERFKTYLFIELGYYLLITVLTVFTLQNSVSNVYYSYIFSSCLYLLVLVLNYLYSPPKKNESIIVG